ncbi:F-box protein [Actinidia chinensis var. chinensis]|uniref:F-box protein n=1 Tax=Actinidia chinensis var. chinensis TaxID=1590841 RepID=A0A2R6RL85_ACTCC|nr:F-box protein [Actinidia chinensis var. chinensis]
MNVSWSISDLPQHIIIDILSRLPTKTIVQCKCVCKVWRTLIKEPYFVNLHLSKSPTTLLIFQPGHNDSEPDSDTLKLVEFEDNHNCHGLLYDPVMKFDLSFSYPNDRAQITLVGSVNGLLCFCDYVNDEAIFICNPIVREYVTLPKPKYQRRSPELVYYGFGFSSVSGEYKVVQIFQRPLSDVDPYKYESQGEVYTLGSGKWRSIGTVPFLYVFRTYSVSLNGNLHWLIWDPTIPESISSFDVDKEEFRLFPSPPGLTKDLYRSLGLLEGRLCVCENNSDADLVVWAMNEYGVKESWTKEFVIQKSSDLDRLSYDAVSPLKVWKNGDVLMLYRDDFLYSYSPERKTLEDVRVPSDNGYNAYFGVYEMILHVASFVSLMDFEAERVYMF